MYEFINITYVNFPKNESLLTNLFIIIKYRRDSVLLGIFVIDITIKL
jgi:hypothetical protein